jgi:transposase
MMDVIEAFLSLRVDVTLPPAALFYASRDRTREHPERHLSGYAGILQADAFDGYNRLYLPERKPGPILEALCWSHARPKFFELADIAARRACR